MATTPATVDVQAGRPSATIGAILAAIRREPQLPLVCALALGLRLWGINFGLPYATHPDEPVVIGYVARMLQHHTLNPGNFEYPSGLYFYLFVIGAGYQLVTGTAVGLSPAFTGLGLYPTPGAVLAMRVGVVLLCTAAVLTVYLLARRLVGVWPAFGGALLLALSPFHMFFSDFVTTDNPAATGLVVAAACCVAAAKSGRRNAFLLAGGALGIAAGLKYNMAAGATMLVAAYALVLAREARSGTPITVRRLLRDPRLLGFVCIPAAFLLTTPYALVHPRLFWHDVDSVVLHYSVHGHPGVVGSSLAYTLQLMFIPSEFLLSTLACVGLVAAIVRRNVGMVIVAVGVLTYFIVVSTPEVHFDRNLVPLWPLLAVLAAGGIRALFDLLLRLQERLRAAPPLRAPVVRAVVLALVLAAGLVPTLGMALQIGAIRTSTDVRQTATEWIAENVPAGASIAVESYGPTLDPQQFHITYLRYGLSTEPLDWYAQQGIQYAVASEGSYARYFAPGAGPSAAHDAYQAMFTRWTVVRTFIGPFTNGEDLRQHVILLRITS